MSAPNCLVFAMCVVGLGTWTACDAGPPASLEAGRTLYRENGCASCHGRDGHGDGPVGKTLDTQPRDFRDASAFKQGAEIDSVTRTIATGVRVGLPSPTMPNHIHHHSQVMPSFEHLSKWERQSLALYVISLRTSAGTGRSQP